MAAEALTSLAERVAVRLCGDHEKLRVVLLHLLAEGRPVSPGLLADRLGWPAERVASIVQGCSDTELDQSGQIVGWGLSLLPTTHQFRLGERTLFTWCALDTLMYPAILGLAADVSSRCPITGTTVRLVVQPDEIADLQPTSAVVSIALPDQSSCNCTRETFCAHSYYFASQEVAQHWQTARPSALLLPVADAAAVAREIAAERVRRARRL
jgi:alkylmercury lyase